MRSNTDGFTLIELLVVSGLTTLLIMTVTSVFMMFFLSNSTTNTKTLLKQEGNLALKQIDFLLKNALSVSNCSGNPTETLTLISLDRQETIFSLDTSQTQSVLASNSANITSPEVTASDLQFICTDTTGQQTVSVAFTLSKITPTLSEEKVATEDFLLTTSVRNSQ